MPDFDVSEATVNKANKFIEKCEELGWSARWRIVAEDSIQVTSKRLNEKIEIEWTDGKLAVSPIYWIADFRRILGNASACIKTMSLSKPDMDPYYRWQRAQKKNSPAQPEGETPVEIDTSEYTLPFDIVESEDSEILKAIRGNTIIYRNSISGAIESEFVPYRTSDDKIFNWDLNNVFFLAESSEGRAFVSFMNSNGVFRCVHLDRLIGVV